MLIREDPHGLDIKNNVPANGHRAPRTWTRRPSLRHNYCCLRGGVAGPSWRDTSSSSVSTPWQSLGWRKTTGLPWAPILGGLSGVIPWDSRCLTMASRSST